MEARYGSPNVVTVNMRVNLSSSKVRMTKHDLNGAQISATDQVTGERMPQQRKYLFHPGREQQSTQNLNTACRVRGF